MSLNRIFNLTRQLTLLDLETTDKEQSEARILQIGMRVYWPSGTMKDFHTLVNPLVPISQGASDTHHITQATIDFGCAHCHAPRESHPHAPCAEFRIVPTFKQLGPALLPGLCNSDFAGYNVLHFDLPVLAAEYERIGLEFDYSMAKVVDGLRIWSKLEPRTLTDAVEHFGEDEQLTGAHDAMNDVLGTEVALLGQFLRHPNRSVLPRNLDDLHTLCFPRDPNWVDSQGKFIFIDGVPCFNFGKWGKPPQPMRNQAGYLKWMLGQNFTPEVKRIVREAVAGNYPVQHT